MWYGHLIYLCVIVDKTTSFLAEKKHPEKFESIVFHGIIHFI